MSSEATAGQVPDIYDQVHPVETEDLVRNKLRAMQDEVAKLPESATTQLRNAQSNCPHLLTDDFRLMFLRCEVFNADLAAKRYAHYWEKRVEICGPDKAFLPLTLASNGALVDDHVALTIGFVTVLPGPADSAGRGLLYVQPGKQDRSKYTRQSMARAVWYLVHALLRDPVHGTTAQQHGIVFLAHPKGAKMGQFDRGLVKLVLGSIQGSLPVRLSAFHICQPPSFFKLILPIAKLFMTERTKKRLRVHFGSADQICQTLVGTFGMHKESLPATLGGDAHVDMVEWIAERKRVEEGVVTPQEQQQDAASPKVSSGGGGGGGRTKSARAPVGATSLLFLCCLTTLLASMPVRVRGQAAEAPFQPIQRLASDAHLFAPPPALRVQGPTHFPKPTHKIAAGHGGGDQDNVQVLLQPVLGRHRPDQDAVFAYAEGYRLSYYMFFMETLTKTGFRGDVVLAIAEDSILHADVKEYLKTFVHDDPVADASPATPSVVVYQIPLYCDGTPDHTRAVKGRAKELDTFQFCQLGEGVYGRQTSTPDGTSTTTVKDPRGGRTVATLRYEWYWMASLQYNKHSWIMLLDARDAYFQTDPFSDLPRETEDSERPDGILYFFGENANATRLGISRKNRNWLTRGYGNEVIEILKDYPTICSGSTMGEQVAIETYLRAMVNEHDECEVRMTGSDQGFHNYLYYSQKLGQASSIRRIVVWEQGRGMINNLGALRTQPLEEWGNYDPRTHLVYQWDGATLSPVVHQWDRDNHLHKYLMNKEFSRLENEWRARQKK